MYGYMPIHGESIRTEYAGGVAAAAAVLVSAGEADGLAARKGGDGDERHEGEEQGPPGDHWVLRRGGGAAGERDAGELRGRSAAQPPFSSRGEGCQSGPAARCECSTQPEKYLLTPPLTRRGGVAVVFPIDSSSSRFALIAPTYRFESASRASSSASHSSTVPSERARAESWVSISFTSRSSALTRSLSARGARRELVHAVRPRRRAVARASKRAARRRLLACSVTATARGGVEPRPARAAAARARRRPRRAAWRRPPRGAGRTSWRGAGRTSTHARRCAASSRLIFCWLRALRSSSTTRDRARPE